MSDFKPGDLVVKTDEKPQWLWAIDGHHTLSEERYQAGAVVLLLAKMDSSDAPAFLYDWLCLTSTGIVGVITVRYDCWKVSSAT